MFCQNRSSHLHACNKIVPHIDYCSWYFFVASYVWLGDYRSFIDASTHLHHMQGRLTIELSSSVVKWHHTKTENYFQLCASAQF